MSSYLERQSSKDLADVSEDSISSVADAERKYTEHSERKLEFDLTTALSTDEVSSHTGIRSYF